MFKMPRFTYRVGSNNFGCCKCAIVASAYLMIVSSSNVLLKPWKGGGVFDREFTKSLIIRDFDDVLRNPFRYVHLFLLHTQLSKKIQKIVMQDL